MLGLFLYPQNPSGTPLEYKKSSATSRPFPSSVEEESPPPKQGDEIDGTEWVSCPVCGRSIHGTGYGVNSHLGKMTLPRLIALDVFDLISRQMI